MELEVKDRRISIVLFKDIRRGGCFTYDDSIYIKTESLRRDGELRNAVELETGISYRFVDNEEVQEITNLIIEIM